MYPSLRELITCHLYPYGVRCVVWDIDDASYDELIARRKMDGIVDHRPIVREIVKRRSRLQTDGVSGLEVVSRPVVVAYEEVDRVHATLCRCSPMVHFVGVRVVASREQESKSEEA